MAVKGRKREYNLNEAQLRAWYIDEGLNTKEIASHTGCGDATVCRNLARFNIPRRKSGWLNGYKNSNWNGGRYKTTAGYILISCPGHPKASPQTNYIPEHILLWEQGHNQVLPQGYVIHHLNGIKGDNRLENLTALPRGKHHGWLIHQALQQRIRELEENHNAISS